MTDAPRVSIVICAYNAEHTIERAIESIRAQSFTSLEIVVIDDGSTDATSLVVSESMRSDSRIRLIRQDNAGVSVSRNRGIVSATADLVAFLDADDFWMPSHLQSLVKMLEQDRSLSVVCSNATFVDIDGHETGEHSRTPTGDISARSAFSGNPCTTCSTMLIRKSTFEKSGYFTSGLDHAEDQEWLLRTLLSGHKMACSGLFTVAYRASPNGQSSDLARMFRGFEAVKELALRLDPGFGRRYGSEAEGRMCLYLSRRAMRLGQGPRAAVPYLLRALKNFPALAISAPLQLVATALVVLVPRFGRLVPVARALLMPSKPEKAI